MQVFGNSDMEAVDMDNYDDGADTTLQYHEDEAYMEFFDDEAYMENYDDEVDIENYDDGVDMENFEEFELFDSVATDENEVEIQKRRICRVSQ